MECLRSFLGVGILPVAITLLTVQLVHANNAIRLDDNRPIGSVHIPFVENRGQAAPEVAYYSPISGGMFSISRNDALVLSLSSPAGSGKQAAVISFTFEQGNSLEPDGVQPSATRVSYFKGKHPAQWWSDVTTYQRIALGEVYEGVHIEIQAHGNTVEKLFQLRPGSNPSSIAVKIGGADEFALDESGDLLLRAGGSTLTLTRPLAYEVADGSKKPVNIAYRLTDTGYAFDVGEYDTRNYLVIDPLIQSTYLGSSERDEQRAIALHPASGDAYLVGTTPSSSFPGSSGGAQSESGGDLDVYVARLNAELTELLQVTYLGGESDDEGYALAIHPETGDIYVTGGTTSTDFPVTSGAAQSANAGGTDAFVSRLNAGLTTLQGSTHFGGSNNERGFGVGFFLGRTDRLYIAGDTLSDDLPGTGDAPQPTRGGGWDGYVAALDMNLGRLSRATYLGGGNTDQAIAVTVNPVNGKILVTGYTVSEDFPATAEGAQPDWQGSRDGFVAILEPDVRALRRATYLGGSRSEYPSGIALHPASAEIYIVGYTNSDDFPVTRDAIQGELGGMDDLFVARLDPGVMSVLQATYLGGNENEASYSGTSITIDSVGDSVYVTGQSTSADFPGTAGGAQSDLAGPSDALVARLSSDLNTLEQATYLGGSGHDTGQSIAFAQDSGEVYVAGHTDSIDFPATIGGAQPSNAGENDAFVARLDTTLTRRFEWKSSLLYVAAFLMAAGLFFFRKFVARQSAA